MAAWNLVRQFQSAGGVALPSRRCQQLGVPGRPFAFVLSGKFQVRDNVYGPGDFLHEVNGMVHGATTALEDTEYLFFCDGPVLFFDKDGFTGYRGWEQVLRMQQTAMPKAAE